MMASMQKTSSKLIVALIVVLVLVAGAFAALYFGPVARETRANDAAENVLLEFGTKLKNVSLTAPASDLATSIEENYGPYVTEDLMNDWKANPSHVPGRLTASSTPDRLGVSTSMVQGSGRIITGEVILVNGNENTDTVPFVAQLIPTDSGWKIAAYQEEKVQTLKNIPKTDEDIPGAR